MTAAVAAAVRERPVLMSGPMVRASLEGRKTQTRRVVKLRPRMELLDVVQDPPFTWLKVRGPTGLVLNYSQATLCPYGGVGDRLWVREAWTADFGDTFSDNLDAWWHEMPLSLRTRKSAQMLYYAADDSVYHAPAAFEGRSAEERRSDWVPTEDGLEGRRWQPSIHMPRWASRLTLELTDVRVERLQDISEADCDAEGMGEAVGPARPRDFFRLAWNQLNHARGFGWDVNPWVWVLGFRRIAS